MSTNFLRHCEHNMLAIDVLLLGYFYKFNSTNLDAIRVGIDYNKVYEKLNAMYAVTIEEAKRRGVETMFASGFIREISGNILGVQVKYIALGNYVEDIDYLLNSLYDFFNVLGLEKTRIDFFIYYHPRIKIECGSKIIDGIIIDKTLLGQENFDVKSILRMNAIKNPDKKMLKEIFKAILKHAIHKNVLVNVSDNMIELCLEEMFRSIDKDFLKKFLFGIHEKIDVLTEKLCEVNEKIIHKYREDVEYVNNALKIVGLKGN